MRHMIAGNWKMNKTVRETEEFLKEIMKADLPDDRDVLICPPFTSLQKATAIESKVKIGAQNMHFKENGAFTGEISPLMLKELGVEYVIIGHSERRHVFLEDDVLINNKVKSALKHGLKAILCVGETIEERHAEKTKEIVKNQVLDGLLDVDDIKDVILAYEPVWAIGTGETATPGQAEEVHAYIRSLIAGRFSDEAAAGLRILYGGSVKPGNIKAIMDEEDVDGVLVGGASLEVEQFLKLVNF